MKPPPQASTDLFEVTSDCSGTIPAPTQAEPIAVMGNQSMGPGDRFGEFVILRELGEGGFATVFLAYEIALERRVALKISEKRGLGEGQALAELEHEHIVRVHAQFTDSASGKHCLSLQYVPGTTLAGVIHRLRKRPTRATAGKDLLDAIVADETDDVKFDAAGLRNREMLASCGFAAAVCRIGQQLADALQYAHGRGILHCDIKPANILVNPYGRPLLADFNISLAGEKGRSGKSVGGTVGYMPPEQLANWLKEPNQRVDERSDIYALGVVLFELLTGRLPFDAPMRGTSAEADRVLLKEQRAFSPTLSWETDAIHPVVERVLRRCLDPNPDRRYANAGELARALANAFELLNVQQALPTGRRLTQMVERSPVAMLIALTLLPHLISTIVNIAYNLVEIRLNDAQFAAFGKVILGYNSFIYPVCFVVLIRLLLPSYRGWTQAGLGNYSGTDLDHLRARILRSAGWISLIALAGWLPGGVIFPLVIDWLAGPLEWKVYAHFAVSFALSGLIAVVYSYFGVQFVVLRVLYPRLGNADTRSPETVRVELDRAGRWLAVLQGLAAAVPLTGAVLLIVFASGEMTIGFRVLVASLIVLGMIGVGIAVRVTRRLMELIRLLRGG